MKYVIGDIHGEFEKLRKLLGFLEKDATEFIFLGDYIDKGPRIRETVDLLIDLSRSKNCVFLMGDHEYAWLHYLDGEDDFLGFLLRYGCIQTLESYLNRVITIEEAKWILQNKESLQKLLKRHMDFYLGLKFYHTVDDAFLCVHAGINPENKDIPLELHNTKDLIFIRNNFISSKFYYRNMVTIFGHTASKEPYVDEYKIGIDTGATYESIGYGDLTAFNITRKEFITHKGGIKKLFINKDN